MKQILFTLTIWVASTMFIFAQFQVPALPYKYNALEPYIDSTTMFIHLNNHHAAYVANLNKALEKYPDLQKKDRIFDRNESTKFEGYSIFRNSWQ